MWDERAGSRERLYLLTRIGSSDPSPWIYNAVSDRWSNGRIGFKVGCEADESLRILKNRGMAERAALNLTRDGLGAGVQDEHYTNGEYTGP